MPPQQAQPHATRRALQGMLSALVLALSLAGPAAALGTGGTGSGGTGGSAGIDSDTAAGGAGGDSSKNGTNTLNGGGGGGGSAGTLGGNGGSGSSHWGTGGAGGGSPGADGVNGSNGNTEGAGGGGGGAHGYIGTALPAATSTAGGNGGNGGASTGGGGGGGNGGTGTIITGSSLVGSTQGAIHGGSGGNGGAGGGYAAAGQAGGGGNGGNGLRFTNTGHTLTIDHTISGGNGGSVGSIGAAGNPGGTAGSGGNGIVINSSTLIINSSITGGNGGAAGGGTASAGGYGIEGSDLKITVASPGRVEGGLNGDGITRQQAIRFTGGTNTLTLEAGATLTGGVTGTGNDTFVLGGAGDASFNYSSEYSGFSTLEKTGAGLWAITGADFTGDTTIRDGRLNVGNRIGSIGATTQVLGGTLGGSGTVQGTLLVGNGGTLAPGGLLNALIVNGSTTFSAGSIFQVGADAGGQADHLIVHDAVSIDAAAQARVLARPGDYAPSTRYTLITGNSVTGQFSGVTTDLAFLTPSLGYDPAHVFLTLTRNATALPAVARTPNERSVAHALEQAGPDDTLYQQVVGQTAEGARQAYNALSGEAYASTPGVLLSQASLMRKLILNRLQHTSGPQGAGGGTFAALDFAHATKVAFNEYASGITSDVLPAPYAPGLKTLDGGLSLWVQGLSSWGRYDDNAAARIDNRVQGVVAGLDMDVGKFWRAGIASGYARSELQASSLSSSADMDSYLVSLYAGGPLGPLRLHTGASWSWNEIQTSRTVAFPGFSEHQRADYHSQVGQLFAELAYPFDLEHTAIEPFAGLAWTHLDTDGYTESSGTAALKAAGSRSDVGYSTLGLRASIPWSIGGLSARPRLSVAWQHAFGDTNPGVSMALADSGARFTVFGVPLARDSMLLEAGLDIDASSDLRFGLSYAGQFASGQREHGVKASARWQF